MKFTANKRDIFKAIKAASNVVQVRNTLPVLSNLRIETKGNKIEIVGTDLESEVLGSAILVDSEIDAAITVPAKKLHDVIYALPDDSVIKFELKNSKMIVKSARSKFTLSTLSSDEFPISPKKPINSLTLKSSDLAYAFAKTSFSMAINDVRYYLNGALIEIDNSSLKVVTTDGHRMSMCNLNIENDFSYTGIIPRKSVIEMSKLISSYSGDVVLNLGESQISLDLDGLSFTSKLVDGKFPDYKKVIPDCDVILQGDTVNLKNAFKRVSLLSNDKFKSVKLNLTDNNIMMSANNSEQEESLEDLEVKYSGSDLEVGFNVLSLIDVLSVIDKNETQLNFKNSETAVLIDGDDGCDYVVMPMRL